MSDLACAFHPDRRAVARCARCASELCQEDTVEVSGGVLCTRCVSELAARKRSAFSDLLAGAPVTKAIIAINVIVFIMMVAYGAPTSARTLIRFGALPGLLTRGEVWRLVSAMFVHIGPFHLFANMFSLMLFGGAVEHRYGKLRFAALYLCAGVLGAAASFAFADPVSLSAGASGAIFGILGAWLPYVVRRRDEPAMKGQVQSWAVLLGIQIYFSISSPRIDVRAHIGGLIGGLVIGSMIEMSSGFSRRMRAGVSLASYAVVLLAAYRLAWPHVT